MTTGIPLDLYPTSIPDDALDRLRHLATTRIVPRAPRFGAWVEDFVDGELVRRIRTETGVPREPAMPALDTSAWSGAELGEALVAGNMAANVTIDPTARQFMERVFLIIVAESAHRLKRVDLRKERTR
jgi:hypothetical protein